MTPSDTLPGSNSPATGAPAELARREFLFAVLPAALATVAATTAAAPAGAPRLAPPPPADRPLSRIAFGACHKLDRPTAVWDVMLGLKPELFLFTGDTIYKDTLVMDEKRAEYAKLAAVPEFARFRAAVPIMATWDDHDYGANDAGAEYPKRDEAQQVFLDFFAPDSPDDVRRKRPGVYSASTFGPPGKRTQIILLDTRYFRSPLVRDEIAGGYAPQRDPAATMLGDAQWAWLADQLKVPADLRLLVSSIPVFHEQQPNEKWDNMPAERAKLFSTITLSKATGIVLISGDRHRGEMSAMRLGGGYRVYELTSSGLNCPYEPYDEPNRHRIADVLWTDNFGLVEIDWSRPDPTLSLQLRTGKAEIGPKRDLLLSDLRPNR